MRKWLRIVLMTLSFLVLTAWVYDYSLRRSADPFWRNVGRVEPGMELQKVEALLGGRGHAATPADADADQDGATPARRTWKYGKGNEVMVAFDARGRVLKVTRLSESRRGLFDRLHDWLGW